MSLEDIYRAAKTVEAAAKHLEEEQEYIITPLAIRMSKAAGAYPEDQTIKQMAAFLNNRAKSKFFITRKELKEVYNSLYTRNTKCAEVIPDVIEPTVFPEKAKMSRSENEGLLVEEAFENYGNPALANALSAAFEGKDVSFETYSAPVARAAEENCAHELNRLGATAHKISTMAGQEDILICKATYETPKGQSSVLIPVEVSNGRPLLPTVFLTRAGFVDLEGEALTANLINTAGKKWQVDAQQLLKVVSAAKTGPQEPLSEIEQMVANAAIERGTPVNHTPDALLYQEVDPAENYDVELPVLAETESFSDKLSGAKGIAEFTMGKEAVDAGRDMLKQCMRDFGYANVQVAVADVTEDTVFFAVAVSEGAGFKAPVKIKGGLPVAPSVIISNGAMSEFSQEGVSNAIASQRDFVTGAMASEFYGSKPTELIEAVRKTVASGEYAKTEEILNVLSQSDQKAFRYAFGIYQGALEGTPVEKTASEVVKCSMQVKHSHSQHIICGHTNMPLHKVYQDNNGDCQPLYRKNIENSNEGGSFLHSRIYLG